MLKQIRLIVMMMLPFAGLASADAQTVDSTAVAAATEWARLIDAGDRDAAWNRMVSMFRNQVPREDWEAMLNRASQSVGKVTERTLLAPPLLRPEGDATRVVFRIKGNAEATQTIDLIKEEGQWRVIGFGVR